MCLAVGLLDWRSGENNTESPKRTPCPVELDKRVQRVKSFNSAEPDNDVTGRSSSDKLF